MNELMSDPVFTWLAYGTGLVAIALLAWCLVDFILEHTGRG